MTKKRKTKQTRHTASDNNVRSKRASAKQPTTTSSDSRTIKSIVGTIVSLILSLFLAPNYIAVAITTVLSLVFFCIFSRKQTHKWIIAVIMAVFEFITLFGFYGFTVNFRLPQANTTAASMMIIDFSSTLGALLQFALNEHSSKEGLYRSILSFAISFIFSIPAINLVNRPQQLTLQLQTSSPGFALPSTGDEVTPGNSKELEKLIQQYKADFGSCSSKEAHGGAVYYIDPVAKTYKVSQKIGNQYIIEYPYLSQPPLLFMEVVVTSKAPPYSRECLKRYFAPDNSSLNSITGFTPIKPPWNFSRATYALMNFLTLGQIRKPDTIFTYDVFDYPNPPR